LTASTGAPGEHHTDAMVARRQIHLAGAVALAELHQPAGPVDAQALDRIARPAATVGFAGQALFGCEHAVAVRGHMAQEVRLAAEQAKPVLDLPFDVRLGSRRLRQRGWRLRQGRWCRREWQQHRGQEKDGKAQGERTHDGRWAKGKWAHHR
jgi:hypothetical protein